MKVRLMLDKDLREERERISDLMEEWQREHLEPMIAGRGFPPAVLTAYARQMPGGQSGYRVHLKLHVPPRKILLARAEGNGLPGVAKSALKRLQRELKCHLELVRHQELYKRKARRERLEKLKAQAASPAGIHPEIEALLPRLEVAVRRELAYLRNQEDLLPDYPTPEEVCDEMLLIAERDWEDRPRHRSLLSWLLSQLSRILDREVEYSRQRGEMASTEQMPELDAFDISEDMIGEERLEFWQPDESLRIEDIVAYDEATDPEEDIEEWERVHHLYQAASLLPIHWRRALFLHYLEELSLAEVAEALNTDETSVSRWIVSADEFLHAKLTEAGFEAAAESFREPGAGSG